MVPQGVMPHPWWRFWQIGDFLIMLAIVVFFVRYVRRSDARTRAEEQAREASEASMRDGSGSEPSPRADGEEPDGGAGEPDDPDRPSR